MYDQKLWYLVNYGILAMTGREKLHFHLTCSQERVGEEGQALFFVLRRTIFSQHVRLILYLFSQH